MTQQFLHIPGLVKPEELAQIEALMAAGDFVDGKVSATGPAREVKQNRQLDADGDAVAQIRAILIGAIGSSPLFNIAAQPLTVSPFVISSYGPGDHYGWHVDSPLMGDPPLRTDLAMTIFLGDPASYQGGELVIQGDNGALAFKPACGDAVLYPCQHLHCVNTVHSGTRLAAVTWIQSNIKDAQQRQLLFQLNQVHGVLAQRNPGAPETQALLQIHSNLFRMWAEM
jgi:PKHD-type hydroxylase